MEMVSNDELQRICWLFLVIGNAYKAADVFAICEL